MNAPGVPQLACPACGHSLATDDLECASCGVIVQKFLEREHRLEGSLPLPVEQVNDSAARWTRRLWCLSLGLLTCIFLRKAAAPPDLSDLRLEPADSSAVDPCAHTERCLLISVAPWCGVCHGALPFIQMIRDRAKGSTQYGVKIITSYDKMAALCEDAQRFGENTYLDPKNQFAKKSGYHSFPTWAVIDAQGHLLRHFAGAPLQTDNEARAYLLTKLGLTP